MLIKNSSKLLTITVVTMLMSSCYNGARADNMSVGASQDANFGKYAHNIRLVNAENATRWDSRVSDENFQEALSSTLYSNDLINEENPSYELTADIIQLTPPSMNYNMYVTSDIQYVIRDVRDDKIVVDKTIESRTSASTQEEPMLTSRKRVVDERAINDNIGQFMNYLRK